MSRALTALEPLSTRALTILCHQAAGDLRAAHVLVEAFPLLIFVCACSSREFDLLAGLRVWQHRWSARVADSERLQSTGCSSPARLQPNCSLGWCSRCRFQAAIGRSVIGLIVPTCCVAFCCLAHSIHSFVFSSDSAAKSTSANADSYFEEFAPQLRAIINRVRSQKV